MSDFKLFPFLKGKMDKTALVSKCSYRKFYEKNSYYFSKYTVLKDFDIIIDSFSLIKSTIVLKGVINKTQIEESSALYKEANLNLVSTNKAIHSRMPHFEVGDDKIYVPFFSLVVNRHYDKKLSSLLKAPFSALSTDFEEEIVDPFFTYGYKPFDSDFTNLLKVGEGKNKEDAAFYSIELETVFIVDNQGTLEMSFPIYDSKIVDKRKDHLIPSLVTLMSFYFDYDKEGFIDSLYNFHLISFDLYQEILEKEGMKDVK